MKRNHLIFLRNWLGSQNRQPLIIRGARQVGKTWLVRHFAENDQKKELIELNFEKEPQLTTFFQSNDPKQILLNLGSFFSKEINPHQSLLFLDEIQAAPELLAKLRWFAEDLPELPVIAAGSLLEFVLEDHTFSMPVGRIGYMYMEPLSFEEFLVACKKEPLVDFLKAFNWNTVIPPPIHTMLLSLFKEYIIIGGMPAAVQSWINSRSLSEISQIHRNLISTYRDDFAKYSGQIDKNKLDKVLTITPKMLGQKFVYSKISPGTQYAPIKQAFDLLCKARVCHRVTSVHANGIPIEAELNKKFFKAIFLDIGLCSAILNLTLDEITSIDEISLVNKGGIAEQAIGQILRTINPPYIEPELYYWLREGKGSAEIDYIIQQGTRIIPIEVKAGSAGSLKSLHLFMGLKNLKTALRINSDFPSQNKIRVKDQDGNHIDYTLLSIPLYLIGQTHRLIPKLAQKLADRRD